MTKLETVYQLEITSKIIIKMQVILLGNYQFITNLLDNVHKTILFMILIVKNVFHANNLKIILISII
jgi:hypothetical protein